MRKKIKNIIDTFSNYDTDTKMFIILLITSAMTVLMLTAYFFQKYIALIFTLAVVVVVFAWDSICSAYQHLKHPQGTCESCCIGCDAMYPFVLTTVYETLKTISPVLHFSIPPTDRQIQSICPPKADGLPRWAFRVMKQREAEPQSTDDIINCFNQTLADTFYAHSNTYCCSGIRGLYVESVKQDDYSVTFFIMPYCPSLTASYIDRMMKRDQVRKDTQTMKGETHIYDDQI